MTSQTAGPPNTIQAPSLLEDSLPKNLCQLLLCHNQRTRYYPLYNQDYANIDQQHVLQTWGPKACKHAPYGHCKQTQVTRQCTVMVQSKQTELGGAWMPHCGVQHVSTNMCNRHVNFFMLGCRCKYRPTYGHIIKDIHMYRCEHICAFRCIRNQYTQKLMILHKQH